ncbi:MAG: hypothetical protein U5R48_08080 [Gammaproteobacteria bacterium]|nr:hypothetical protein [Gammaproteobacteria bacterium]
MSTWRGTDVPLEDARQPARGYASSSRTRAGRRRWSAAGPLRRWPGARAKLVPELLACWWRTARRSADRRHPSVYDRTGSPVRPGMTGRFSVRDALRASVVGRPARDPDINLDERRQPAQHYVVTRGRHRLSCQLQPTTRAGEVGVGLRVRPIVAVRKSARG